jgi:mannose-6-phosphate isomerase
MGAHPSAPSGVIDVDGREINLLSAIEADPNGLLGPRCRGRYGARLPFLLKVIAAEQALSVQVHPASGQIPEMRRGSAAAASAAGSGRGRPAFADTYGKPEVLVAVEPFEVLAGLRTAYRAGVLLGLLDIAPLMPMRRALTAAGQLRPGPGRAVTLEALVRLAQWPQRQRAVLSAAVTDAARSALLDPRIAQDPDTREALDLVYRLAAQHPDDPTVLAPLLLDVIRLEPGQAVYIPPGVPHCYLEGLAVEAGAASDNIIRAGLTHKAVDPVTLQRLADPGAVAGTGLDWVPSGPFEEVLAVPVEELRLSRVRVADGRVVTLSQVPHGPQMLLCMSGEVIAWAGSRQVTLGGGESAYLGPEPGECVLGGTGEVFRIAVGAC